MRWVLMKNPSTFSTSESQGKQKEKDRQETKNLSKSVAGDVWSSISSSKMIHFSQKQGRVWNAIRKWSCSSPREHCCLTLRFSVWTSAAHLICVYLTWRIRVQSVHLSPPTFPTTALLVIKLPRSCSTYREMNNDCADEESACHNLNSHEAD